MKEALRVSTRSDALLFHGELGELVDQLEVECVLVIFGKQFNILTNVRFKTGDEVRVFINDLTSIKVDLGS